MDSVVEGEGGHRGRKRSAVQEAEMLLGAEDEGFKAVLGVRLTARDDLSRAGLGTIPNADEGIADKRPSDIRERREVLEGT